MPEYVIEMLHITKEFPGIKANDDVTLQLRRGEIRAAQGYMAALGLEGFTQERTSAKEEYTPPFDLTGI